MSDENSDLPKRWKRWSVISGTILNFLIIIATIVGIIWYISPKLITCVGDWFGTHQFRDVAKEQYEKGFESLRKNEVDEAIIYFSLADSLVPRYKSAPDMVKLLKCYEREFEALGSDQKDSLRMKIYAILLGSRSWLIPKRYRTMIKSELDEYEKSQ